MSGTIQINIDNCVTHIFIEENNPSVIDQYADVIRQFPNIMIIRSNWIDACFKNQSLLNSNKYIISKN